jgi:hypothetical protein
MSMPGSIAVSRVIILILINPPEKCFEGCASVRVPACRFVGAGEVRTGVTPEDELVRTSKVRFVFGLSRFKGGQCRMLCERHHSIVGEPDKGTFPLETRLHLVLEPFV